MIAVEALGPNDIEFFLTSNAKVRRTLASCGASMRPCVGSAKRHFFEKQLGQFGWWTSSVDPFFEVRLDLAAKGSRKTSKTLYCQLKRAILDGRLMAGAKLPPTRNAATYFGVSRNTASTVYERLTNDGYVVSRRGSGTYVAVALPDHHPAPESEASRRLGYRLNEFWLRPDVGAAMGFWRDGPTRRAAPPGHPTVDFRPALTDSRLFPFDVFRRVHAKQLRGLETRPPRFQSAQGNQGNFALREAIRNHIGLTRAVVCDPDDIVVTSGAQQAFDLLARVLVTANETVVAVEDPGYPPMRVAFAAAGAKLVPIAVDAEGLRVDLLPPDVGIICLCPSHQFPLGVTMSAPRRQALIAFARNHGAVIVEDDYDGEFRYDGAPLEALRSTEATDVVFYVGTFSKCMLASLRLGFIVAPAWAMATLIAAKNCLDWHCSTPIQMGVAAFIAQGHLARHVRRLRKIYGQRRQLLLSALGDDLTEWLEPVTSLYGMHVSAVARGEPDLEAVAETLLQDDVKIHTFSRYYLGPRTRTGLVFGYGVADLSALERGLASLRNALLAEAR